MSFLFNFFMYVFYMLLNPNFQKKNPIIQLYKFFFKNFKDVLLLDQNKINYSNKDSKFLKSQNELLLPFFNISCFTDMYVD